MMVGGTDDRAPRVVTAALRVLDPGPLTTVQDAGRAGHAHVGVPPSGAADGPAFRLANRLVGNAETAAVLETTLAGPTLLLEPDGARADGTRFVAVTGAPAPLRVGGRPAALYGPVAVRPGQRIELGPATAGLRSYLAVSGGIVGERHLGSLSHDLLSGLGMPPLRAGATLVLGPRRPGPPPAVDAVPVAPIEDCPVLEVIVGPRSDWLADDALATLAGHEWTCSPDSDRVGVRLVGPPLRRSDGRAELRPEGLVTGAIQVPPNGQPVLFGNDHPVTGGYPVLAVLAERSLPAAAQLRPGSPVRFRLVRP